MEYENKNNQNQSNLEHTRIFLKTFSEKFHKIFKVHLNILLCFGVHLQLDIHLQHLVYKNHNCGP